MIEAHWELFIPLNETEKKEALGPTKPLKSTYPTLETCHHLLHLEYPFRAEALCVWEGEGVLWH